MLYYSFVGDVVLDPFAGSGTTGQAAATLNRTFVLVEAQAQYVNLMAQESARLPNVNEDEISILFHQR